MGREIDDLGGGVATDLECLRPSIDGEVVQEAWQIQPLP